MWRRVDERGQIDEADDIEVKGPRFVRPDGPVADAVVLVLRAVGGTRRLLGTVLRGVVLMRTARGLARPAKEWANDDEANQQYGDESTHLEILRGTARFESIFDNAGTDAKGKNLLGIRRDEPASSIPSVCSSDGGPRFSRQSGRSAVVGKPGINLGHRRSLGLLLHAWFDAALFPEDHVRELRSVS